MVLGTNGLPDIIVVLPPGGLFVGLEVKSAKGKLRPSQEKFKGQVELTGGKYYVVRSVYEARSALAACGWKDTNYNPCTTESTIKIIQNLWSK